MAAEIRMEDAAFGGLPQICRHIERPDCQILVGYAALRVMSPPDRRIVGLACQDR